jgi:hypothetical protein
MKKSGEALLQRLKEAQFARRERAYARYVRALAMESEAEARYLALRHSRMKKEEFENVRMARTRRSEAFSEWERQRKRMDYLYGVANRRKEIE